MIALLQRVTYATVSINNEITGKIDQGILAFLAIEPNDTEPTANRMIERVFGYRIFADSNNKMNLSVRDINGDVLLIPQFTLAADTTSGMRPSFTTTANPKFGEKMFDYFVEQAKRFFPNIASGTFGADMKINLCSV